jgi:hypothetical protein
VDVSARPNRDGQRSRWRVAVSALTTCALVGAGVSAMLTAGTGVALAAPSHAQAVASCSSSGAALAGYDARHLADISSVSIATTSLARGTVGEEYVSVLSAAGGTSPYTWNVTGGSVPAGLTLTLGGVLSGTPTKAGTYNFTVQVTDAADATATQALTLIVNPGSLTVAQTSLPGATDGASYSTTLSAVGGAGSYLWTIVSGSLPSGLSLNVTTGVISGTPTAAGTFVFTVQVTDSDDNIGSASLSITVSGGSSSLKVTTAGVPSTGGDAWYAHNVAAAGGTGSDKWSVSKGSLPRGLHLNASNGWITGRATVAGKYTFTVKVTDSAGASATRALTIWVSGPVIGKMVVGELCGRTVEQIYGSGLSGPAKHREYRVSVRFGSHLGRLVSASPNAIVVVPPSGRGTVQVTVTVDGVSSQATKAGRFRY